MGGVGAVPGAIVGGAGGAVLGTVWGSVSGFLSAATSETAGEAARNGAWSGTVAGTLGGVGAGVNAVRGIAAARQLSAAAETAAASRSALVPMSEAAYSTGTVRTVVGYEVGGTAGRVGDTYNMNIWGLYNTESSQGLSSLANALRSEAAASGASRISITGNAVINKGIQNLSPRAAARLGFEVEKVNPTTVILRGTAR